MALEIDQSSTIDCSYFIGGMSKKESSIQWGNPRILPLGKCAVQIYDVAHWHECNAPLLIFVQRNKILACVTLSGQGGGNRMFCEDMKNVRQCVPEV